MSVTTTAVQAVTSELSLLETTVLPRRIGVATLVAVTQHLVCKSYPGFVAEGVGLRGR